MLVWNQAQKREAVDLHGIEPERVIVTGAQLFDRWFHKAPTRDRVAFAARVGLPRAEPFILFTGSSMFISAPDAEVAFVKRWIEALRASAGPGIAGDADPDPAASVQRMDLGGRRRVDLP